MEWAVENGVREGRKQEYLWTENESFFTFKKEVYLKLETVPMSDQALADRKNLKVKFKLKTNS